MALRPEGWPLAVPDLRPNSFEMMPTFHLVFVSHRSSCRNCSCPLRNRGVRRMGALLDALPGLNSDRSKVSAADRVANAGDRAPAACMHLGIGLTVPSLPRPRCSNPARLRPHSPLRQQIGDMRLRHAGRLTILFSLLPLGASPRGRDGYPDSPSGEVARQRGAGKPDGRASGWSDLRRCGSRHAAALVVGNLVSRLRLPAAGASVGLHRRVDPAAGPLRTPEGRLCRSAVRLRTEHAVFSRAHEQ